jgi:hypothetical protein
MNPEQQPGPAPYQQPSPDPYQFIMESPKKQKTPGTISGNPFLMKILLLIGGAIVLLFAIGILVNILFGSRVNVADLTTITQTQQEIIRIAEEGRAATSQTIKNAAMGTQLALTTQQQETLAFLNKNGKEVKGKELNLKKSSTTDKQLEQAKTAGVFDSTYSRIMREKVEAYASQLRSAHGKALGRTEKTLLTQHFNETQLLLDQWPAATP